MRPSVDCCGRGGSGGGGTEEEVLEVEEEEEEEATGPCQLSIVSNWIVFRKQEWSQHSFSGVGTHTQWTERETLTSSGVHLSLCCSALLVASLPLGALRNNGQMT